MLMQLIHSLAENMVDVLTLAVSIGVVVLLILYVRARQRHVHRLLREIRGEVPLTGRMKKVLSGIFNVSTAEITTAGAVTFADIAFQYSMADPQIWDHFQGSAAQHIADAIQNLDVLKSSLGDHSLPLFGNLLENLKHIEATQVFNDLAQKLPLLEGAHASTAIAVQASGHSLVDSLAHAGATSADVKANAVGAATTAAGEVGLIQHLPLVTIGFATYRAWRRSQKGTTMTRNLEFAGIEVATRAGGGIVGGQIGGVIGTAIAPGLGTLIGGVAGAVAGTIGGMFLGEDIKKRHILQARQSFDSSLQTLGSTYLENPVRFRELTEVFLEHEAEYITNFKATRRRLFRYSTPWRIAWPDQKLILLQETVHLAEKRLGAVKQEIIDAIDRLNYMQATGKSHDLGVILWSNAALRDQLDPDPELVARLEGEHDKLSHELIQLHGQELQAVPA